MSTYRLSVAAAVVLVLGVGSATTSASGGLPAGQSAGASLVAVGAVAPDGKKSRCPSLLGCGDDLAMAVDLEQKFDDHLFYGLANSVSYGTSARIPGDVRATGSNWGDAGIFTGNYLAAESFRYALARDKLQTPHRGAGRGQDREFWQAQQAEAKVRIDQIVAQVDLRTNISRQWTGQFAPAVDPSPTPPGINFGGGVVQGEPGMLMKACTPADAPVGFGLSRGIDVRGPWRWTNDAGRPPRLTMPEGDYLCYARTTRDTYAGTLLGLLTAFDLVSADDSELRTVIRDDILLMANYLLKSGWTWVRPDGTVAPPAFPNSERNFISPLMTYAPTYRLGVSQAARHVARAAGPASEATKWEAVWAEEFASQATAGNAISHLANDPSPTADYYGLELAHLMYFNLIRLAEGPVEKATFRRDFSIIDRQTSDDVNAEFETISYTMTGEQSRLDAAVQHLREWREWRAKLDSGASTNNTARCGTEIECVPADQYDIIMSTPAGETSVTVPGNSPKLRAVEPLPIPDRRPTDYLWQRSPFTNMDGGGYPTTFEEAGIDYLLTYWMLRYYTEIAPPPLDPIPVWPGPAFSGS